MNKKKRAGRPRSQQARQAILQAAHEMLGERGFGGVTVEAVAERAGVGKPTIYRYWANALELAMAAVMAASDQANTEVASPGNATTARQLLREHLMAAVLRFNTPAGRQVTWLLAAAEQNTELFKAFRNQLIMRYRDTGRIILQGAIETAEIRPDTAVETTLDMLYGPFFYRLLSGHATLTESFAEEILDTIWTGIAQPAAQASASL